MMRFTTEGCHWQPTPIGSPDERHRIVTEIMGRLPEWFGIVRARRAYADAIREQTAFACYESGLAVGLIALKAHSSQHVEVAVMGVLPEHQRRGVGRALIAAAERDVLGSGGRYLSVKTLSARRACQFYARTRAFYRAVGFAEFEEFPTLWGVDNPCLIMLKDLQTSNEART